MHQYIFQKSESHVRVSFLPNVNGGKDNKLNKIVLTALQELTADKALSYVISLLRGDAAAQQLERGEDLDIPVSLLVIFF